MATRAVRVDGFMAIPRQVDGSIWEAVVSSFKSPFCHDHVERCYDTRLAARLMVAILARPPRVASSILNEIAMMFQLGGSAQNDSVRLTNPTVMTS